MAMTDFGVLLGPNPLPCPILDVSREGSRDVLFDLISSVMYGIIEVVVD